LNSILPGVSCHAQLIPPTILQEDNGIAGGSQGIVVAFRFAAEGPDVKVLRAYSDGDYITGSSLFSAGGFLRNYVEQ
jgi:hypothetical protein